MIDYSSYGSRQLTGMTGAGTSSLSKVASLSGTSKIHPGRTAHMISEIKQDTAYSI